MDIGTPERYLQATWDILEGRVRTARAADRAGPVRRRRRRGRARRRGRPARGGLPGCAVGAGARGARLGPARRLRGRRGGAGQRLDPRPGRQRSPPAPTLDRRGRSGGMRESRPRDHDRRRPRHPRPAARRPLAGRIGAPGAGEAAGLLVCGMGGSAIGGDLAAAALGDRLTRPLLTVRGYSLPSWATPEWTVLCSSYSGETEETLACFAAAEALGARRIVVSTGGAAGRPGPRGRGAGGRPARDLPAPRRGRLHVHRRRRGRGPGRRRAADPHRDRRRRRLPRRADRRPAPSARPRSPPQLDGAVPVDLRRRPDRPGGAPLEDAGQRERQAPGLLLASCRRPTTTRSAAGPSAPPTAGSPPSSSRTATSTRASGAGSS